MKKEQFIQEANRLAAEFAQLCYVFNKELSAGTGEMFGTVTHDKTGVIVSADITFSMQQHQTADLSAQILPATIDWMIGAYDSAKMLQGNAYPQWNDEAWSIAGAIPEWKYSEYEHGEEVEV